MTRVACVRIPRFALAGAWGIEPGIAPTWDERPLALTAPASDRIHVASAALLERGVLPGMRVAAAQALAAELEVRAWDDATIARAVNRVTMALLAVSPQVTPGTPGLWWVGVHGLSHRGERAVASELARLARTWHPGARAALASTCVAARAATWLARDVPIIPAGDDAAFLARTPLALVPMDAELRATLRALGVTRAGQLAALAPADVEARWGATGLAAWRLAHGDDPRRPALAEPPQPHLVSADLPVPATTLEPVLFLVRAALARLVDEVARDGRAIAAFDVTLVLDGIGSALPTVAAPVRTVTRRVACAVPLARVEPLFEQCRAVLDDWALEAPVTGVAVQVVERVALSGEQGDLLHTGWRDPAAAEAAFARLRAALGGTAVVRPEGRDAHAPERRGAWSEGRVLGWSMLPDDPDPPTVSLRLLPSPERIEVEPDPLAFRWRGRRWVVATQAGPERLSGDWWSAPYARDYWHWWSEGTVFVVFRAPGGEWMVQGWHD
jgi:nucleotidyltransferase/DNA polymerase involved in DNA repair